MADIKTRVTDDSVEEFLESVEGETKKLDSLALLEMFRKVTKEPAKMWGNSMVGFGQYHYKSERSAQEGDWPLIAFSPRKANLTIYIMPGFANYRTLLEKLGKHKTSVGCLYIKKLADIDTGVLEKIIDLSYKDMKKQYS